MIIHVEAMFSCDDCGTKFTVKLDPAYEPPSGWSVFAVAEDKIRHGDSYEDATDVPYGIGSVGEDGRHYCARCTKRNDAGTKP
jgi:hypothetical protein